MKRSNWLLIGLVVGCLTIVPLLGCVGVSQSEFEALQSEYEAVNQDLTEIKEVYPPKNFPDAGALETWLSEQQNPPKAADAGLWYKHARDLQESAARDGYMISACISGPDDEGYYYVWCVAVLKDNSYYEWDPDTDEIYFLGDVRYF